MGLMLLVIKISTILMSCLHAAHILCGDWGSLRWRSFLIQTCLFILIQENFLFWGIVCLYDPDCPGTHCVDQAYLKFTGSPPSASLVLGLNVGASTLLQDFF